MSEKLHNEDFDVIRVDGNVLSGDSNKIKLKMISYGIVMEVQETFMKEELEKQNKELNKLEANATNPALTEEQKTIINENIESLRTQIKSLTKVYEEFSNAHQKFMEVAKKALKVHEDNIEQMKKSLFYTEEYEPEMSVDFSDYEKAQTILKDAQDANIFSNVDSEAIKEEVNRVMTETRLLEDEELKEYENDSDWFAKNMTPDDFAVVVHRGTEDVQKNLKQQEPEKISKANIEADLDKYLGGATTTNTDSKDEEVKTPVENNGPIFDQEQPIEPEYDMSNLNQNNSETERRYTTLGTVQNNTQGVDFNGDTDFQQFLTSRQEGLNEKSSAISSLRTEVDTLEQTAKDKKERLAEATRKSEQDAADMEIMAKQLEELKRLEEEENKLSSEETTLNDRKSELNSEISGYDEQIDEIEKQNAANLEKYKAMQEEINKYLGKYSDNYTTGEEEKGLPRNVLR